jgi:hypothetical protein
MPLNIQPNIVVTGDYLGKLRSEEALRQAQIANYLSEPGFRQQQLNLEQRKQQVSEYLGMLGIQHDEKALAEIGRHNVTTEGLQQGEQAVQKRGQDLTYTSQENAQKAAMIENVSTHLASMLSGGLSAHPEIMKTYGDVMAEYGDPAVQKVLARNDAATKAATQGAYGPDTAKSGSTTTSPATDTPGYIPSTGNVVRNLPLETANLGARMYNYGIVPPMNLVNSLVGAPPLHTAPMMTDYPSFGALLSRQGATPPPAAVPVNPAITPAVRPANIAATNPYEILPNGQTVTDPATVAQIRRFRAMDAQYGTPAVSNPRLRSASVLSY